MILKFSVKIYIKLMKKFPKEYFLIGFTKPIFVMFVIYMAYLMLGAICFLMMEKKQEEISQAETRKTIRRGREMINTLRAANYSDTTIYYTFMKKNEDELKEASVVKGYMSEFGDKVFFSFILITTIGYGNVSSNTTIGQIITIIYTFFGLPMHVTAMRLFSLKIRGCLRKVLKVCQEIKPKSRLLLYGAGFVFFLSWMILFFFIPSYIFMRTEEWDYYPAVYFSFVTLTTIGLGDYISGASHMISEIHFFEMLLLILWIFLGLGFVTMSFNMLSYAMGVVVLDKLDCKCKERAVARRKLKPLLDIVNEINWQLIKGKPSNFTKWDEIENFKSILIENPQDVTPQMLLKMFDIAIDLKEHAYEDLHKLSGHRIPLTPIIQQSKDSLPGILGANEPKVSYSESDLVDSNTFSPDIRIQSSKEDVATSSSDREEKQLNGRIPRVRFKSLFISNSSARLLDRVRSDENTKRKFAPNADNTEDIDIADLEDSEDYPEERHMSVNNKEVRIDADDTSTTSSSFVSTPKDSFSKGKTAEQPEDKSKKADEL